MIEMDPETAIILPIITISSSIAGACIFYMLLKNNDSITLKIPKPTIKKKVVKKKKKVVKK